MSLLVRFLFGVVRSTSEKSISYKTRMIVFAASSGVVAMELLND